MTEKRPTAKRPAPSAKKRSQRAAPRIWPERPPEILDKPPARPERGPLAILHDTEVRGRRSSRFPDLNIAATAKQLGITKSHLGRVLAGTSRPGYSLVLPLAELLGKDADYVMHLYNGDATKKAASSKRATGRKKQNAQSSD